MAAIRTWAPSAERLEIETGGKRRAMRRGERGWWSIELPELYHGIDYAFRVDGEGPFADPRSLWQPEGPDGPSRWLDPSHFQWTDERWQAPPWASAVIYELHIGAFTPEGTFDAAREKLDRLVELGINYVEVMPIAQFSGRRGWGYDGVDLYAPHNAYGDPERVAAFVDACHAKGIGAIIDVVYNHLGPSGNNTEKFAPYFTDKYKTHWGRAANLDDAGSDEARRFFIDNALMWLRDYHFDGLRIDAVHALLDTSATHFLEELATEVRNFEAYSRRRYILIAESDLNDPRVARSTELGGYGLDAQWNEDFHHALHALLTGEDFAYYADFGKVADLAKTLRSGFVYDGRYSEFRDRRHGRPIGGLSASRFVGYMQNHDQIGNRPAGDRIGHVLSLDRLKLGAAVNLLSPFVPMLFQGEEWAASAPFAYFAEYADPELGKAVSEGRKREFSGSNWDSEAIPDPHAEETFERAKLDWSERERAPHAEALAWYKALIALRRSAPDFTDGRFDPEASFDEAARWLAFRRGRFLVVCNFGPVGQRVPVQDAGARSVVLASNPSVEASGAGVWLPPFAVAALR